MAYRKLTVNEYYELQAILDDVESREVEATPIGAHAQLIAFLYRTQKIYVTKAECKKVGQEVLDKGYG